MNGSMSLRILPAIAAMSLIALAVSPARAEVLEKTKKVRGVEIQYKVVLPNGYDSTKAYPGIIALGGGPQTMSTVDGILSRNFRAEAEKPDRKVGDRQDYEHWARVEIRSPQDGTVMERNIALRDLVDTSTDLFKIAEVTQSPDQLHQCQTTFRR